jgi:DNA-directed RNA polymerase beta subunit
MNKAYTQIKKYIKQQKKAAIDSEYTSMSPDIILGVTKKLVDINKGIAPVDERDSVRFKRIFTPDKLFRERIALDSKGIARKLMYQVAKRKTLKAIPNSAFDTYAEQILIGNQLSSPLEEINPAHLLEQKRRITQMGEGGIKSDQGISEDMQNLHPHEFGFLASINSPESGRIGIDTRAAWQSKIGSDGLIYQRFKDRKTGRTVWLNPTDLDNKIVGLPD